MSFENIDGCKQHLNLSLYAYKTLIQDMNTFGVTHISTFINIVFEQYYPIADASISRVISNLRGTLDEILIGLCEDETKKKLINKLIKTKEKQLIQLNSYDKGISFKFCLNKKNLDYLTSNFTECNEDKYYSRRGLYIKCVIEEFTRLPYVKRELIYFNRTIDVIKTAIDEKKQLCVITDKNKAFSVFPYQIIADPLSTANYLIGYSKEYNSTIDDKQPCSFRISALHSIKIERSKSGFIKESDQKQLSHHIISRGVQFMVNAPCKIHVKLTEAGIYKYRRYSHLRPNYREILDNNIYVFDCTAAQAEFYFFKFGKDAEIIKPLSLREKFHSMYKLALDSYTDI